MQLPFDAVPAYSIQRGAVKDASMDGVKNKLTFYIFNFIFPGNFLFPFFVFFPLFFVTFTVAWFLGIFIN